nr:hypothetical protein [Micromonospora sp. DSM 115978]
MGAVVNPAVPTVGCPNCQGIGADCVDCRGRGRLRAQLVISVANPRTGQVASANLVPGALDAVRNPSGGWRLPVGELVVDLAAQAGVAAVTLREPDLPQHPVDTYAYDIHLPPQWRPDLATGARHALEARALARGAGRSWIVLLGHAHAPRPADHARLLGKLRDLADQLRVDLVIDARRVGNGTSLAWDIHLAHPGAPPPHLDHLPFDDLLAAIAGTTLDRASTLLGRPGPDTPAHYFAPDTAEPAPPAALPDVDRIERLIMRDCAEAAGAQAIWRNGRWWHTTLQPIGYGEAGPNLGRVTLERGWEPPAPQHLGEPIPATVCDRCAGTGADDHLLRCERCRGNGKLYHGAVLTVADLRGRSVHRNWRPEDTTPPFTVVATYASGVPVVQLPEHYRVGRLASGFGVQPHDLTSLDGEEVLYQDLRDGLVSLTDPTADPVLTYVRDAAVGLAAGRLIVRANDWPGPGLADLARLALGLGLAVEITAVDHRLNAGDPRLVQGVHWEIGLAQPDLPIDRRPSAHRHSIGEAVAYCLRYLGAVIAAAIPADPSRPIRIPQQPKPLTGHLADLLEPADAPHLTEPVRRLAAAPPRPPRHRPPRPQRLPHHPWRTAMIQVRVTDRAAVAARSPSELAMYLRTHGWAVSQRSETGAQWVKVVDGDEFEALQPLESGLRDYAARVADLLHVVSVAEGRSELAVLADIAKVSMDLAPGEAPGDVDRSASVAVAGSAVLLQKLDDLGLQFADELGGGQLRELVLGHPEQLRMVRRGGLGAADLAAEETDAGDGRRVRLPDRVEAVQVDADVDVDAQLLLEVSAYPIGEGLRVSELAAAPLQLAGKQCALRRAAGQQEPDAAGPVLGETGPGDMHLGGLPQPFPRHEPGGDLGAYPDRDLADPAQPPDLAGQPPGVPR